MLLEVEMEAKRRVREGTEKESFTQNLYGINSLFLSFWRHCLPQHPYGWWEFHLTRRKAVEHTTISCSARIPLTRQINSEKHHLPDPIDADSLGLHATGGLAGRLLCSSQQTLGMQHTCYCIHFLKTTRSGLDPGTQQFCRLSSVTWQSECWLASCLGLDLAPSQQGILCSAAPPTQR